MRAASTSPWRTSTGCRAACRCCARSRPRVPDVHMEDVHRAGGIMAILGELDRAGLLHRDVPTVHSADASATALDALGHQAHRQRRRCATFFRAAPGGVPTQVAFSQERALRRRSTSTARRACIRDAEHAFSQGRRPGGAVRQPRRGRLHREDRRRRRQHPEVRGPGAGLREPGRRGRAAFSAGKVEAGDVVVIRYEGPRGGPGMQEMLYPTSYLKSQGPGQGLRADHRRPLLRRHLGPVDRPRLAGSGRGRR